jgi:formamidopyrimidine-DNA glycosylase
VPELPEVETVRRGLAQHLEGAQITAVRLARADLRFPFPKGFAEHLIGQTVIRTERRAKYLLFRLSNGKTWLSHLGMTGTFRFTDEILDEPSRYRPASGEGKHEHVEFDIQHPQQGRLTLIYTDARRFGFMDLFGDDSESAYLKDLGPEPLGNGFHAEDLARRIGTKKTPIKTVLLDQRVVAGIGNIYASEALHRAHILPTLEARALVPGGQGDLRLDDLVAGVRTVLIEAIEAGGSTLRDFRATDGGSGYFQHRFAVYDREGEPCPTPQCRGVVQRLVQGGRSSFYCPVCQH